MTIGQIGASSGNCGPVDLLQASVTSGPSYTIPETGTITSWSHLATGTSSQTLTMKVFRFVGDPNLYRVVAHDGPKPISPNLLNTFRTSISVQPGDILGLNTGGAGCTFTAASGDILLARGPGNLADGEAGMFSPTSLNRVNISALLEPANTVTVGATTLNKKKGTATLNLTLPNAGDLTASGKGVTASSAGGALISKAVGAGAAQLLIKAKGKKKRKLNDTGKVKLNVTITYTPQNGNPASQTVKVKLKKV